MIGKEPNSPWIMSESVVQVFIDLYNKGLIYRVLEW